MKIAMVGIDKRVEEIQSLTSLMDIPFEISPYPFGHYNEALNLVKKIKNVDGILFVGSYSYFLSKSELDRNMPAEFFEFDETGIMKLITSTPLHQAPEVISIDTVQSFVIKQIYRELNLPLAQVSSILRSTKLTVEDIAKFHIKNYLNNNNTKIISGFYSVSEYLKKMGYPCMLIKHTYFSVQKGYNKILDSINYMNSSGNHPAIVIIKIDKNEKNNISNYNEIKYQKFLYKYFNYMLDIQEQLQSFVFNRGSENYFIISTRNLIEKYTNKYRSFPLLYDLFVKFNITVSVGIGYGTNPASAMSNAKEALELASKHTNTVRILTQWGQVLSPADKKDMDYSIKNFNDKTIRIAENSGVTPENISKISGILARRSSQHMTAHELSEALGITPRSGNRLISSLVQAGYAKESGVERPAKGRPRHVYEIAFKSR